MEETKRREQCSDEQLVILAQSGNDKAQAELFKRYAPLVRRRARCFFLIGGETEDLIQEGMMGLLRAIGEYSCKEGEGSFSGFAFLCVTRRIIDAVKASARLKNVPLNNYVSIFDGDSEPYAETLGPEDEMLRKEDRREFLQRMSRVLSDFEFRVIVMYMDGMSCLEICQATGKDGKSVDNAIQRSKKKLQKIIKR